MTEAGATVTPEHLARRIVDTATAAGCLLLCTDFDGSVAPIVEDPELAEAVPAAGEALTWLSRPGAADGVGARCPVRVAVITARDAEDAAARVALGPEAVVVGNHGLDRLVRGRLTLAAAAVPWVPALDRAHTLIADELTLGRAPGARLERKRCSVVIHTRGVEWPGVEQAAERLADHVARTTGLRLSRGKQAVELRVPVLRDKATAVRALRRTGWRASALCTAGDDHGDVRMLQLAGAMPDRGTAVAVMDAETPADVVAAAAWRIRGPWEWAATLGLVADGLRLPDS